MLEGMPKIIKGLVKTLKSCSYKLAGRRPWTLGYAEHKAEVIRGLLADRKMLACFSGDAPLPRGFGFRLDERVIELPWAISGLSPDCKMLLDAGSALNYTDILDLPIFAEKRITIMSLAPERIMDRPGISYVYGDLRHTEMASGAFDEIVCISTLEHIGMDNTVFYTQAPEQRQKNREDYKLVVAEFHRLLKLGGKLWITVPYGRREDHGWFQQFDGSMVQCVIDLFGGRSTRVRYFRYFPEGWRGVGAEACADCHYFELRTEKRYGDDLAAAARSVACLELTK
jgi:hypothetical protein